MYEQEGETDWKGNLQFRFDCLETKIMFPLFSKIPFSLFPSGKDAAKTASSLRSSWKTTTRRCRTPSTRAGTWPSPAKAVRGRPPRPSSTRGRPTSWSACPGATCWARGGRLTCFRSPCRCTPSASGLNTISSARGAAEDRHGWPGTEENKRFQRN